MSEIHVNRSNTCGYCELPGHAAADCPDRKRFPVPSELDKARAALKHFGLLPGFVGALERFEAAVRANERATPLAPVDDARAAELLAPLKAKAREIRNRMDAQLRADALREAAAMVRGYDTDPSTRGAADELDRMADEAQP